MAVARLVNWHGTLEQLGYPVPWKPKRFVDVLQARMCANQKTYTGAYIVSTNGNSLPKEHYLSEYVLTPLWKARKDIRPRADDALESFFRRLTQHRGMGGFMAGQVIADLKYAQLIAAPDWPTWAASGPGSRRGLNRVLGRPVTAHWQEKAWHEELLKIRPVVNDRIRSDMADLHAQDLQNATCEFDKWCRVKNGEGQPRSRYPGV